MAKTNLSGRFNAKSITWSNDELIFSLGYYYFIYQTNTREKSYEQFATELRSFSGNQRTNSSVKVRFSNYDALNPNKTCNGFKNYGKNCEYIWNLYMNPDGTPKDELIYKFLEFIHKYSNDKTPYMNFISKYNNYKKKSIVDIDDEDAFITTNDIIETETTAPSYIPEIKPELIEGMNKKYKRSSSKARKSIVYSNFQCNIDADHKSFMSRNGRPYMEAHHLIPMSAQEHFENSLDVDANIVSLCPICHRKLHHGKDIKTDLKKLFDIRIALLRQSGIELTFDDLLKYYK